VWSTVCGPAGAAVTTDWVNPAGARGQRLQPLGATETALVGDASLRSRWCWPLSGLGARLRVWAIPFVSDIHVRVVPHDQVADSVLKMLADLRVCPDNGGSKSTCVTWTAPTTRPLRDCAPAWS
jgi:hypothetical protein